MYEQHHPAAPTHVWPRKRLASLAADRAYGPKPWQRVRPFTGCGRPASRSILDLQRGLVARSRAPLRDLPSSLSDISHPEVAYEALRTTAGVRIRIRQLR